MGKFARPPAQGVTNPIAGDKINFNISSLEKLAQWPGPPEDAYLSTPRSFPHRSSTFPQRPSAPRTLSKNQMFFSRVAGGGKLRSGGLPDGTVFDPTKPQHTYYFLQFDLRGDSRDDRLDPRIMQENAIRIPLSQHPRPQNSKTPLKRPQGAGPGAAECAKRSAAPARVVRRARFFSRLLTESLGGSAHPGGHGFLPHPLVHLNVYHRPKIINLHKVFDSFCIANPAEHRVRW